MRKSKITDVDLEKKMTAGVRHAKIICVIALVVLVALVMDCAFTGRSNAAAEGMGYVFVVLMARWLFDGLESIISLLCDLNSMPSVGTKFPDAAYPQQSSNVPDLRSIKMPEQAKYDSHETAGE